MLWGTVLAPALEGLSSNSGWPSPGRLRAESLPHFALADVVSGSKSRHCFHLMVKSQ
jgi:hypothetical protein